MINLIAAIAPDNVIGDNNNLPWYYPEDLKRFRQITQGHTVLMGRKTYHSIIKHLGKPLPNRKSVVVTRQVSLSVPEEVTVLHNLQQALEMFGQDNLFVLGGADIFRQVLPVVEKAYITHIHKKYAGDIHFPEVDWSEWKKIESEQKEDLTFATYQR